MTRFEIASRANPRLKELLADRQARFFFAGEKLVRDILARGARVDKLLVATGREKDLPGEPANVGELWLVSLPVLQKVSGLEDPPPLVAVLDLPRHEIDFAAQRSVIGLVDVQDPGNVGTILRCASAFGVGALALAGACARPNNPKVVRAAQTALLDVPFQHFPGTAEMVRTALAQGAHVYVTGSRPGNSSVPVEAMTLPCLLLFGSEGRGLDPGLLERFPLVRLEQKERLDSLNVGVSACILMRELQKLHGL
ncbi:MAG: RNA methyltransferase [Acidobacteria bacterium]|jgi:TrmH family RNA methyltransferase|nr:RNA methyltransferase [Acidobacteriota bacterium]